MRPPPRPSQPWFRRAGLLLAALAASTALALNPGEKPADYIVTHWDTEDGLPHNSIKQLLQTRDGYLWIGTVQGLARFDGLTFTIFTQSNTPALLSNQITTLAEAADGSLWIGTSANLVRYAGGVFTSFTQADGLKDRAINAVKAAPDGSLWIGGMSGIVRRVGNQFVNDIDTTGHPTLGMRNITLDHRQAVWLTIGKEVMRYQAGAFTSFGPEQGLPKDQIQVVTEDAGGRILAATQNGLFRLEGGHFVPWEHNAELSSTRISRIIPDRAGNLWIGSVGGLDRFHDGKVVPCLDRLGHKLGIVDALLEDREGCLWVGTSDGLIRLTDRRATTLTEEAGVSGSLVLAVKQSQDGSLWVSSWGAGVVRIKDGVMTHYNVGAPLSHETVTAIAETPGGVMWFGNRGCSVDRLENGKVTTYVYPSGVATSRPVNLLFQDDDGTMLLGIATRGLFQLRQGEIVPVPGAFTVRGVNIWSLHRAAGGRLLMGTSIGLFQRDPDRTWHPVAIPSLPGTLIVRDFLEADDGLWLATEGRGLVRWQHDRTWAYDTHHGMVDDILYTVLDDGQGALWVSSARGLARIRKSNLAELDRGAAASLNCLVFGQVDGLASGSSSGNGTPGAIRLTDGRIMTTTVKGLAVVDPRLIQVNMQPPSVVIESVLADDRQLPAVGEITLAPGIDRLEIRYTALSLIAPHRLRFRYKLEGSDTRWIEAEHDRRAHYTNLPPGHYSFHVLACNNDGIWNETGTTLALTLLPRFYQTLWFRLGTAGLGLALLAFLVWLRIRQLHRRQLALTRANAELDQRVRERTSELADTYKQLVDVSRMAGMAEVATGVLHNVGNVLNSLNVSASIIATGLRQSKADSLAKVAGLLHEHRPDLAGFLTADPKGRRVPELLGALATHAQAERDRLLQETASLQQNVDHIKDIVAMQQAYATLGSMLEPLAPAALMEDALRMHGDALARHSVRIEREFSPVAPVLAEKAKVLQILVNLIKNAKQACDGSGAPDKVITLGLEAGPAGFVRLKVRDNGVGIPPENLTRIFAHGFTTKPGGHGFGVHASANAAREMKGALTVRSEGPGTGATFSLDLPTVPPSTSCVP